MKKEKSQKDDGMTKLAEEQVKIRITNLQFCDNLDVLLVGLQDGSVIQLQISVEEADSQASL